MFATRLNESNARITGLQTRALDLQNIVTAKNERIQCLQRKNREIEQKSRSQLAEKDKLLADSAREMEERLQEFTAKAEASEQEARELRERLQLNEDMQENNEQEKTRLREKLLKALAEKRTLKTNTQAKLAEIQKTCGEKDSLATRLFASESQLADLQEQLSKALAEKESLRTYSEAKMTDLQKQLLKSAVEKDSARSDCEVKMTELHKQLLESVVEKDSLRTLLAEYERSLADLQEALAQKDSLRTDCEGKMADLQEQLSKALAEKESLTNQSEAKAAEFHNQLLMVAFEKDSLRTMLAEYERSLADHKAQLSGALAHNNSIGTDFGWKMADLQEQLAKALAEKESLSTQSEAKVAELQEQLLKTVLEKESFAGRLSKLQKIQERELKRLKRERSLAELQSVERSLEIGGLNSEIEKQKLRMAEQAQQLTTSQLALAEVHHTLDSTVAEAQQKLEKLEVLRAESAKRVRRHQRRVKCLERQLARVEEAKENLVSAQTQTDDCAMQEDLGNTMHTQTYVSVIPSAPGDISFEELETSFATPAGSEFDWNTDTD